VRVTPVMGAETQMLMLAIALMGCVLVLGFGLGPLLERSRWACAHPGSAALCWVCAVASTVATVCGFAVIALLWPPSPAHGLMEWMDNCLPHHGGLSVAVAAIGTLAVVWACYLRLERGIARLWRATRHRRRHQEMLGMVAREDERHADVLLIDHPVPVAYCMRGRGRIIVLSTGVLDRLSASQVEAVLAHERTHLRHRHHLVLSVIDIAYAVLPWLPILRRAQAVVPVLLEMTADDVAVARWGPHAVIGALRGLVPVPGPAGTLAATGGSAERMLPQRLSRLQAAEPVRRGVRYVAGFISLTTVSLSLAVIALAMAEIPPSC
jgi:Zn-dependent protease with chaperone function